MVEFHALGGLSVTDGGTPLNVGGPRQRRLLAMLLIHRNTVVSTDRLTEVVFAGQPTPAATTTMRSYVARMRKVVDSDGTTRLVTQPPGYLLRVSDSDFDVARFETGVAEGRSLLARGEASEAATVLRTALTWWCGPPYAEFGDEEWAQPEAQRLAELLLVAQEVRYDAELAAGRAAAAVPELESLVARHPLRERFVAQLMVALYRTGRQADALRAFSAHRAVVVEELGLDPSSALRLLEEQILAQDPELLGPDATEISLRGYRLGQRLGTGHDGTVQAAHLPGVDRDLVIRTVRPDVADSADFVRRFEANALRIASLGHPAVVPVHDYWREPGAAYVVMRRLHGGSLADRLDRTDRAPLSTTELLGLVRRIGGALVAAADAGLVHGRVSPRNVLFDDRGDPWLTDFDLVQADLDPRCDGRDLVAVVAACRPDATGSLADVLARVLTAPDTPPIREVVDQLDGALSGGPVEAGGPAGNPYKGLRAFDETDAADFFGRQRLVEELLHRLRRDDLVGRLVLVVGGSGTGKSSVVRAGLVPCIRRGDVPGSASWFVTTMLPGATPFKELAAALRRVSVTELGSVADELAADGGIDAVVRRALPGDGQLLLVIDQFEELFTSAPEHVQRRFLDELLRATTAPDSRLRVVGTLRADFYDRPLAFHGFGAVVNATTVTIPAMSAAELEAAIVEPARRAGREIDRALVAELVAAAVDEPAGLPALQFTLFELAERAHGDLTLDAYRDLGGLDGAIASRAEALYRSLDPREQAAVRRLFGQLVAVRTDAEPTRRRALRHEVIAGDPGLGAVIDRWIDARLLSADHHRQSRLPTVEPAHEALLREWPRLRRWIEEDRGALVVLGHLREATASWVELDRDAGALYRGSQLQVAVEALGDAALGPQEREFLAASRAAQDAEARDALERAERQERANRRLRVQLVAIGVALVVAIGGGVVALDQRGEAEDERRLAFGRELTAAADASLAEDPERSLLLALEAVRVTRSGDAALPEAIGALHQAISRSRILLDVPGVGGNLDWSPDGSVFVTEGPEDSGIIDLRDAETGESARSWPGHAVDVNEVAFDHTGEQLASGGDDGFLRVWDTATGAEIAAFDLGGSVWAPSFSPDGRRVAAATFDPEGSVRVLDIASGEEVSRIVRPEVMGTDFSPDGERLLVASIDHAGVVVADVETGTEVLRLGEEHGPVRDARFSPDGRWIASAHWDGVVRVWEAGAGEQRITVDAHSSEANAVDWSADSSLLATVGNDGVARVYEITEGGDREVVAVSARDTSNGLAAVAFSPEGDRILTGDWAVAAAKVWDISERAGAEVANLSSEVFRFGADGFLPDGRTLPIIDLDGSIGLWDVETGDRRGGFTVGERHGLPQMVVVSPDGELAAIGTDRGDVVLHELPSGRLVAARDAGFDGGVSDLAWSHDGAHLAVGRIRDIDGQGLVLVLDRSGAFAGRFVEERGHIVKAVAFTRGGRQIVVGRGGPRQTPGAEDVQVWDWRARERELGVESLVVDVAADPTGDRIAFVRELTGTVEIWDVGERERTQVLRGGGTTYGVVWSPDGERVATAGADGTVRVFDPDTGRLDLVLRGHRRAVFAATFSADGTRLASIDEGGTVRVSTLDLDELVGIARGLLTRSLDEEECRQYLRRTDCDDPRPVDP